MKKYSISLPQIMFMAAFILIDGTFFAIISVTFALLHEMAHIIALKTLGAKTIAVGSAPYGISLETSLMSYKDECLVALFGPFLNFVLFVISSAVCYFSGFDRYAVFAAFSNFAIFAVNILPVFPLDGARALFCFLCIKLSRQRAVLISKTVSFIFLLPLGVISVIILVRSGFNMSLLIICLYLAIQTGVMNL